MVQPAHSAPPGRKRRTEEAVRLAMEGDWRAAAAANEVLLSEFEDDVETANRLGKAYTELGKPKKAVKAYERALEIDQYNSIARKNLERLQQDGAGKPAGKAKAKPDKSARTVGPRSAAATLVNSATAAEFRLQQANPAAVASLTVGDSAELQPNNRGVAVTTEDGTVLGSVEPRVGLRLRRMIEGGNRYDVTIRSVDESGTAVVFIRESYREPSLLGQTSFLAGAETRKKAPRAYTRRSALIDEDDPEITDHDTEDDDMDALGIEDDEEEGDTSEHSVEEDDR